MRVVHSAANAGFGHDDRLVSLHAHLGVTEPVAVCVVHGTVQAGRRVEHAVAAASVPSTTFATALLRVSRRSPADLLEDIRVGIDTVRTQVLVAVEVNHVLHIIWDFTGFRRSSC